MTEGIERSRPRSGWFAARVTLWARLALFLAVMGRGLITGVIDDDATGVAGYSLAGARFGYDLLWVLLLSELALAVVNEMNTRMGIATGKGFADLIRESFGVRTTLFAMITLLVVNCHARPFLAPSERPPPDGEHRELDRQNLVAVTTIGILIALTVVYSGIFVLQATGVL